MSMQQILHKDYTSYGGTFQPSLPLNFEFQIKKDDPVRLLLHCIYQMDLTPLYRNFRRAERNLVSPHQLLAILIYAYMNQIYSSRRIEEVSIPTMNASNISSGVLLGRRFFASKLSPPRRPPAFRISYIAIVVS